MVGHEDGRAHRERELGRLDGVHVADDAAGFPLLVAPVDRKERDLDAERSERVEQGVGDDRVARVVHGPARAERVADEPRALA